MEKTPSLFRYLDTIAARDPAGKLLGSAAGWLCAEEVRTRVLAAAAFFAAQGIRQGDYAALTAGRDPESVIALWGLEYLGAASVLVDPRQDARAFLKEEAPQIPVKAFFSAADLPAPGETDASLLPPPAPFADPARPAYVIFTSGSTGRSKAVVLSAFSLINNILDASPFGWYLDGDIALGALPLTHVFGLVLLTGVLVRGYAIYFPQRIEAEAILDDVEREGITRMNGVPALYLDMAAKKGGRSLKTLRAGYIGGGPCSPEQFVSIERALGITLVSAYGMSECVGITSASWQDPQAVRAATVGRFYPRVKGLILKEDGSEAAPYEEGEICADGYARMIGYFGESEPGLDISAPVGDRPLLHTGDLGYLDAEGFVHISGRKKDIIIRKGNNLSPRRIEEALLSVPGVEDAAVVGLPDPKAGEVPWALYRGGLAPEALAEAVRPLLHKNEWPAGFCRTESLPLGPTGKIDKQKVREVLRAWRDG